MIYHDKTKPITIFNFCSILSSCSKKTTDEPKPESLKGIVFKANSAAEFNMVVGMERKDQNGQIHQFGNYNTGPLFTSYTYTYTDVQSGDWVSLGATSGINAHITASVVINGKSYEPTINSNYNPQGSGLFWTIKVP
ncbi:hypothetical protein MUY27_05330 [Mucilaginibacter sp. RS28]|uniref:Uncharacterized protein n=1 Tax=Mucilaginibacter straminoryzae TaxID=2932774 RepID=A0A9X1X2H3_9SPHI|nr:hypothetical protein [Mucilaginibacter straminoryzae]MCJ8209120.1 hypothetical protein [Mucilaginibacter straminoryzae]